MKYLLIGEKYDRGPGGPLKVRFEAEDDTAAKLKMCAMAFAGNPREVMSLNTYEDIVDYLANEIFDEDDFAHSDLNDPESFTASMLEEQFEPSNGDGMDFFSSLENMSTDETIWEADVYGSEDYEDEDDEDDEDEFQDDEEDGDY